MGFRTVAECPRFYYAERHVKVFLEPVPDFLAVDAFQTLASGCHDCVRDSGIRLSEQNGEPPEIWLINKRYLDLSEIEALEREAGLHPLFHAEGADLVVLPELFVFGSTNRLGAAFAWLEKHDVTITQRRDRDLHVVPNSRRGADAIAVANELTEQVHGVLAAPYLLLRFPL